MAYRREVEVVEVSFTFLTQLLLGMGRTWQIFAGICLLCGGNLSSRAFAKCDPRFFASAKTLRIGKTSKMP